MNGLYISVVTVLLSAGPALCDLLCYRCAASVTTLDGEHNAEVYEEVEDQLALIHLFPEDECLSDDPDVLADYKDEDTCELGEVCGYLKFSLINENYNNAGKLNVTGVIRGCRQSTIKNECFNDQVSNRETDPLVYLYFQMLSNTYGTQDYDNEPQYVRGCFCDEEDSCNIDYDTLNDQFSSGNDAAGLAVSLHDQQQITMLWISISFLVISRLSSLMGD